MARFVTKRIFRGIIALLIFQTLLFILIQAMPYDFSAFSINPPAIRAIIQEELGLDQPLFIQYISWTFGFFRLDLGKSFLNWPTPVIEILFSRAPRTLLLFLSGAIIAYIIGIWLGKLIAWHRGGIFEFVITIGGVVGYTSFAPFLGFVMLNVFGWHLNWFPYQKLVNHNVWFKSPVSVEWVLTRLFITLVVSFATFWGVCFLTRVLKRSPWKYILRITSVILITTIAWQWWLNSGKAYLAVDILNHLVLPLGTVVLLSFGETMLIMRTTMLETISEKYVLMAKAKGLSEKTIRDHHVARNALLPVLTRLLLNLPFVLIGSLAIELVFHWQAMGQTIFNSIEYHDIPMLMGILSSVGVLALAGHILLDILHVYLDPRLRDEVWS